MRNSKKRTVNLDGHITSVFLEKEFWDALKIITKEQKYSLEALITKIDSNRKTSLASSIRVYLLKFYMKN